MGHEKIMKNLIKVLVVVLALGVAVPIAGISIQMLMLNRQASRLVEQSDSVVIGWSKAEVLAAMPADLLVATNPPTEDEAASATSAVSALRYNAPVFLNSVYVLMLFDDSDHLIGKRRYD